MVNNVSQKMNEFVLESLEEFPDFKLVCNIPKILEKRGMTMQDLSFLTGIRLATISDMIHLKRTTINIHHLVCIAKHLRVTDISELFSFEMSEETRQCFEEEYAMLDQIGMSNEMLVKIDDNRYKILMRKMIKKQKSRQQ